MNLGAPEIITILVVALLIFGPKKLPELGRSLGSGIREFRKGTQGLKEELEQSFKEETAPAQPVTVQAAAAQPTAQTVVASPPSVTITKGEAEAAPALGENPKA